MGPAAWTSSEIPSVGPIRLARAPAARGGWLPPYSIADFVSLLWRERFLMLVAFAAVFALGIGLASTQKKSFQAHSTLLVQLGQEYVYNPRVGDAGRGVSSSAGQIMQSELSILNSTAVKERAIEKIGLVEIYPEMKKAWAAANRVQRRTLFDSGVRAVQDGLKVGTTPETSVVQLSFTHKDPAMAARVLNTVIEEYLSYRKQILVGGDAQALNEQRRLFEERLGATDAQYQQFLSENGISDFETEKTSLAQIYGSLLTERYSIQAQLSEVQGRLGVTTRQSGQVQPEIGLYSDVDPTATNKLTQLRVERQDLLSRYRPESQPVREIDQKIAALESLVSQGGATGVSARRIGPNPVFQTLTTEKNQLEAQAASLRQRQATVNADLAQINARRVQLLALEPRFQELARQREVLSTNVRNFTAREQESQAARAIALRGEDNIRVVERAYAPTNGKSLKSAVLALSFLFAAFSALCVALIRILLRRGFVTPEATARSLDLPVLGSAPIKRAHA